MPPPYRIDDPNGQLAAFRAAASMRVRAELFKMLLDLREQPRSAGTSFTLTRLGTLLIARFLGGLAAMLFTIDERNRAIAVVDARYVSPN